MRLRYYKHDVDFVDLELVGDGVGMGMKFTTVSFSSPYIYTQNSTANVDVVRARFKGGKWTLDGCQKK